MDERTVSKMKIRVKVSKTYHLLIDPSQILDKLVVELEK